MAYYGYFTLDDKEYVIRFKVKGSLQWDDRYHCFKDKDWYVRTYEQLIAHAAGIRDEYNLRLNGRFWAIGLTKEGFIDQRARGVPRWNKGTPIIKWD